MPIKKKILIVDDSGINRQILTKILSDEYVIFEALNGRDALEILRNEKESISAVLLDLIMPVMDGYEVMEAMRGDAFLSKIPVIVTTGDDKNDTEVRALSLGANDFILKPYKPLVIKHRLANTINLRETAALVNSVEKDDLTGVLKKAYFCNRAERIIRENPDKKYDIICCDIERFKLVNDLFGMSTGDELLKYIAELLVLSVADKGICGRIGVDQFACLMPHRETYSSEYFENAVKEINRFPITVKLDVSYGIYIVDNLDIPVSKMCDRALIACNSIKGKYVEYFAYYDDALRQKLLSEQTILDNMRAAIQEKQFQVYYQPKYEAATDKIAGAEALIRWIHPQKGFMPPDEFLPLFEKNGFITELDLYVADTVCTMLRERLDCKEELIPISINVSRMDLYAPDFSARLMGAVKKYRLDPCWLHLEITETAYTQNPTQLVAMVRGLKDLGFVIEMDDFGSGYSSLSMLSQLPLDILKLDREFVQNETAKSSSKNILGFIISLAKWLNLSVVAEGVETSEQLETLRAMGCTYIQGYYYARPMPLDDFKKHLMAKRLTENKSVGPTNSIVPETDSVKRSKSKRMMMIVDDVGLNRAILSEIFCDLYTIFEAGDGQTAYDYALENYEHIDIILLDLVMPVLDGFQLLSKLKHNDRLRNIPVIITSQFGPDSEAQALKLGAADFIAKPYSAEVARHRVGNVMAEAKLSLLEREKVLFHEVEEMRYMAEHDPLTGLYNRTAFETKITSFLSGSESKDGCFIMLDIDNFKTVNDVFGHDQGDEALTDIARILREHFRSMDIIARLGGDEFAVFMMARPPTEELLRRIDQLCKRLCMRYNGVQISAAVGASISPQQGTDYQTLYKNADSALLVAKRMGKNQYRIFDSDMEMPSPVLSRNLDWLLDETSDGIVVCDTQSYEVLYLNHVACAIAGCDRKEATGKKCYELLWGNTQPCAHCIPLDRMSRAYCEHELTDEASGKNYIIKGKLTEWGGQEARIQFLQDNTSKAAIAKQLADLAADRKRILDLIPGGIFRYGAGEDDAFDFVSENMYKLLGYTRVSFAEKFHNHFHELVWQEDRERVLRLIAEQRETKDYTECEYRIERADGTLCWVHDIGRLAYDDAGTPWFYVVVMDNTAEHAIKNSLEEEREKLRIALAHSGLQYWEHDLRTDICVNGIKGAELGFADVTPHYSRFLVESGVIPPEYVPLYQKNQQALYDGVTEVSYEIPLYDPSGKQNWWRIRCTNLFDGDGRPIKTIGTADNIEKLKAYEQQREAAQPL